jgi:hypothetical protein
MLDCDAQAQCTSQMDGDTVVGIALRRYIQNGEF